MNNDFSQLSKQISDSYSMTDRKLDSIATGICDGFYTTAQQVNGINTNIMTLAIILHPLISHNFAHFLDKFSYNI